MNGKKNGITMIKIDPMAMESIEKNQSPNLILFFVPLHKHKIDT
jgi:hypothetical protein